MGVHFWDIYWRITLCNYVYSIKKKHELIFNIARHLGDDFKVIRQYISEKCTNMHDNIEKILDISDLQEDFKTVFETKGVLTQYTTENVPAPRKGNLAVNETKIKNDGKKVKGEEKPAATKEQNKEIHAKYNKKKIDAEEDKKIKTKVVELDLKLAENPANTDLKVWNHKDITALLKTLKARVCWCCESANCFIKQSICTQMQVKRKYGEKCNGYQVSFKDLKERESGANTATAQIKVPPTVNSESEGDEFFNAHYVANSAPVDQTFYEENMVAEFKLEIVITKDTIPKWSELSKTAMVADKECIICLKENMDIDDLTIHYSDKHELAFFNPKEEVPESPLSAWIAAAQDWKDSGRTEPAPTDVSAPEYSEGDEYFLSENEEVVTKLWGQA